MQLKISGHHQFTAKPSKALKNISKGNSLEQIRSIEIHSSHGTPILISSKLLRNYGFGQVDICSLRNNIITLYEVKSKPEMISSNQIKRLKLSLTFICRLLNASGHLIIIK